MGMEVAGADVTQGNGEAKENGKVNVSEPIKFGSHGADEQQAKAEGKSVSNANVPKDAVDEWPDAPQVHSFWIVKYRSFEDPNLKAKMDQVDKEILKMNQRISQIIEQLKPKRAARSELMDELRSLGAETSQYSAVINEKRQEMKPLQDALGTLRGSGRGVGICSTEEELNELIRSLEYRIQHESMTLKEEKQLLREIKELEGTRPKVIANTARRAKIQDALGQTEVIQDQVKLLGTDLDGVRKQKAALKARMDQLGSQVKTLEAQIKPLQEEFEVLNKKRDDAFKTIKEMRKTRDGRNECYYQNRNILNNARQLAAQKDLKGLEELVNAEVDKFVSQWNNSKAFRDDYEKRILVSLDMRQLSRDGRMRNLDEKPIVMTEAPRPQTEVVPKVTHKQQKEDPKTTAKTENMPAQKVQSESKKGNKELKATERADEEEEEVFVVGKPKNVSSENKVDEAKLKEMRREEEKEKQRQALERKKKQQEKAAAKAALRAQKEAEKKQKDREKKLKKKEGASAPGMNEDEPTEKEAEAAEQEKAETVEETNETSAPPPKAKGQKENALRQRKSVKSRGTLPKAILKKKSNDYWIWASVAAVVVVVLLAALGYNYFL